MKFTEGRNRKIEFNDIWDLVYDELSADNAHEAKNRKIPTSEVKNNRRFRFDDENAFDRNDGPQNSKHKDARNAWTTDDGFKLKPKNADQEDFAYDVANKYGCKVEPKDGYLYIHCPIQESLNEELSQELIWSFNRWYEEANKYYIIAAGDLDRLEQMYWDDFNSSMDESLNEDAEKKYGWEIVSSKTKSLLSYSDYEYASIEDAEDGARKDIKIEDIFYYTKSVIVKIKEYPKGKIVSKFTVNNESLNEDGHTGATATYNNIRSAINTLIEVGHDYDEIKSILESTLDELWNNDDVDDYDDFNESFISKNDINEAVAKMLRF